MSGFWNLVRRVRSWFPPYLTTRLGLLQDYLLTFVPTSPDDEQLLDDIWHRIGYAESGSLMDQACFALHSYTLDGNMKMVCDVIDLLRYEARRPGVLDARLEWLSGPGAQWWFDMDRRQLTWAFPDKRPRYFSYTPRFRIVADRVEGPGNIWVTALTDDTLFSHASSVGRGNGRGAVRHGCPGQ